VGKNSFLNHTLFSKSNIAVFLALVMVASFMGSRAILSMSMIAFGANALRDVHPRLWLKQRWWLLGLVWVGFYAVSWFWSENKHEWGVYTQVKLPFLLLPLAFAFLPAFSRKQLQLFTLGQSLFTLLGICFSVSFLVRAPQFYIHGYGYSKVLPTPVYDDHISFSIFVVLVVAWTIFYFPSLQSKAAKWFTGIAAVICFLYLHLLSAKTGLVGMYLFLLGWSIYLASRKKPAIGLLICGSLVVAVLLAYRFVPTFNARVKYMVYAYGQYRQGDVSGNYGDIGRIMSYRISSRLIAEHPLAGVGAGDILDDMKKGYDRWYPQVPDAQRLIPHNQFMVIALATGIPSLLFFLWWILAPLRLVKRNRTGFFFVVVWILLLVPQMVDPSLEIQFGVFVYLFFLLLMRHMLLHPGQAAKRLPDDKFYSHISA
jgi:O-antigen ligase